jgi:hypothetical protein
MLCPTHGFRCIAPNDQYKGLSSFYGDDRSFCMGMIFDETDFIIEFKPKPDSPVPTYFEPILHHEASYRGRLQRDNVQIVAVYIKNQPTDYTRLQFRAHWKQLYQEVPQGTIFYRYFETDLSCTKVHIKSQWYKTQRIITV